MPSRLKTRASTRLTIAIVLSLAVAAGLAALAAKCAFCPAAADCHAEILSRTGAEIHAEATRATRAPNLVLGANLFALATLVAALALFGVRADLFRAKAAPPTALPIVGLPTLAMTRRARAETGVATPVRPASVLVGLGVLAFASSLLRASDGSRCPPGALDVAALDAPVRAPVDLRLHRNAFRPRSSPGKAAASGGEVSPPRP